MLRLALALWATTALTLLLTGSAHQDEATSRPRILVTNDDGIGSPGLHALARELAEFADVTVCAPDVNKSGASHSLTYFTHPKRVREAEVEGAAAAFSVDGTPADAAHFGLIHLGQDEPFDLLVSGMNHGANVGDLSHGSGTVGAAMEGAFRGVPSIAVSMDSRLRDWGAAAGFARRFAEQWLERGTDAGVVYSINVPNPPADGWKGVRPVPMGGSYIRMDTYREAERTEDGVVYRPQLTRETAFPEGSDSGAYMDGYVTITPLRFDWTHHEALADLAEWDLELP
jgi:5'-nucleotidase